MERLAVASPDRALCVQAEQGARRAGLKLAAPWCCPRCHGALAQRLDRLHCGACRHGYEQVDGIPDLRVPGASWLNVEEDLATARAVAALDLPADELVRDVFARRSGWNDALVSLRTRQVLTAPHRLRKDVAGWLAEATSRDDWLDLGCGPGMLLAAASGLKTPGRGVGVDVSMTWLVVAKRLIMAHGGGRSWPQGWPRPCPCPTTPCRGWCRWT